VNHSPLVGEQASRPEAVWSVPPPAPPDAIIPLCRALSIPPLVANVLWTRGFQENAIEKLYPELTPSPVPGIEEAAEVIRHALNTRRRILIHGDYDADGISATATLMLGLRELGGNVQTYIPNRLTDGYGIHFDRVAEHASRADLLITVDCGISNLDEIHALRRSGVDVIVTDHHQPGPELPDAVLVHPLLTQERKGNHSFLTGAGVAFHLLWALHRIVGQPAPLKYADIAALGTVADVAPLLGDNRALVREGLARLEKTPWPGLQASMALAGIRHSPTARDIAFIIAPRLNAAGRLGEADHGLELLTTMSERRGRELSAYLDARNIDRRHLQDTMYEKALKLIDPEAPAIVLEDETWHPGVLGIVASKLVERYFQPVFLSAKGKGSVRSPPGTSAVAALRAASINLARFGGHEQAAGFTIESENFPAFREAIYNFVRDHPTPCPTIDLDALIGPEEIDRDLYRAIESLEPFGEGLPLPRFALTGSLDRVRAVGKNRSTLQIQCEGIRGIAWQKGFLVPELPQGTKVNLAISLRENSWQEKRTIEFTAEEIRRKAPLSLRCGAGATKIHRGEPTGDSQRFQDPINNLAKGDVVWLQDLVFAGPFSVSESLKKLVRSEAALYFDLPPDVVKAIQRHASELPTLSEIRKGFVQLQRGNPIPFNGTKETFVRKILVELQLIDENGFTRKGKKTNPYESEILLAVLLEEYRLRGLANAYLYADDEAFSATIKSLFS
jgi:single-stranded-DNA-specific exonuclease